MKSVQIHKNIKDKIIALEESSKYPSLSISTIVTTTKYDARTVKAHLALMEEDGVGQFCDENKTTFTIKNKK